MPFDNEGYWHPELSPKQLEIFNCNKRYLLSAGPKKSGKTLGNLHRVVKHGWEIQNARIGMFSKTVKQAKSGGIWNDMVDIIIPEWLEADIGLKYTTRQTKGTYGPKQDAQSRMQYFRIQNQFGGESEFQLHSLDNWRDVENIAKSTRFSCYYFGELSAFPDRLVFDITSDQLRIPGLPFTDHLWIADTNPSDEGEDSWIYKLWYEDASKETDDKAILFLQKHLKLIEVMIEDNPFLTQEEIDDLYARFSHDKDLFARYIEGKWVRASKDAIFREKFNDSVHVLGDISRTDEDEWDLLLPSNRCSEFITGWDLGDKFHSTHLVVPEMFEQGKTYCVIDECCQLDPTVEMGLSEFCDSFMTMYNKWLAYMNWIYAEKDQVCNLEERHWSDAQALTAYRAGAEGYDVNLIYKYTDGVISVNAAPKFPGSIMKRINMTKILLNERRLLISAKCVNTIDMFKSLRRGTGAKIIAHTKHRHVFDSLTYALASEEPALLVNELTEGQRESGRLVGISR